MLLVRTVFVDGGSRNRTVESNFDLGYFLNRHAHASMIDPREVTTDANLTFRSFARRGFRVLAARPSDPCSVTLALCTRAPSRDRTRTVYGTVD